MKWLKELFTTYWTCPKCGQKYKPSKGEIARLHYWGASGASSCPCEDTTND